MFVLDKSNGSITTINKCNKWQSCTHRWENIYRKEERDWKMVYLARVEDTDHAEIEWKFDFSKIRAKITSISLKLNTKIYENGQISIKILHNGNFDSIYPFFCNQQLKPKLCVFFFRRRTSQY